MSVTKSPILFSQPLLMVLIKMHVDSLIKEKIHRVVLLLVRYKVCRFKIYFSQTLFHYIC